MKIALLFIISFFISITSFSQKEIQIENISKHLGDSVTFIGKIAETTTQSTPEAQSIKLSINAVASKSINAIVRVTNTQNSLKSFGRKEVINRVVRVTGKVESIEGKYGVSIKDESQISFILGEW